MDTQAIVSIVQYNIEHYLQDLYLSSQASSPTRFTCGTSIESINNGPSSRIIMLVVHAKGRCYLTTEGNTSITKKNPIICDGHQWRKQDLIGHQRHIWQTSHTQSPCNNSTYNMPCTVVVYWVEASLYMAMVIISISNILLYALASTSKRVWEDMAALAIKQSKRVSISPVIRPVILRMVFSSNLS